MLTLGEFRKATEELDDSTPIGRLGNFGEFVPASYADVKENVPRQYYWQQHEPHPVVVAISVSDIGEID